MSPPRDPRDRDELEDRLDELESTLTDLRSELRSEQRRGPPKPPSLGELLRFTEEYTIPTLIALLEATIKSLELLRRTLRLADPNRAVREESQAARSRLDQVGIEAGDQLAGALSELRTALSESDLPENPESRRLIQDARDLTGEIESRLRNAEQSVRDNRDRERRANREDRRRDGEGSRDRGVMIDVSDASDGEPDTGDETDAAEDAETEDPPEVDVESELEAIKDELDRSELTDEDDEGDEADDVNDASDGAGSDSEDDNRSTSDE